MTLVALAACGGGGAGEPADSATPQGQPDATAALVLTSDNAGSAASLGLALGDLLVSLAQLEAGAAQAVLAAGPASRTISCANGGVAQFTWTDMNGDGVRGAGDIATVHYTDCVAPQVESAMTGVVVMSVTSRNANGLALTVDYGAGLLMVDTSDQSRMKLLGTVNVALSDDGMTRQLAVASSASDDLNLMPTVQNGSQVSVYTERLRLIDLRKTLSREHARATTTLAFQLQSGYLGGMVMVSTPAAFSSYFDTFPEAGELNVRSAGPAVARIKPNYATNSAQLSYQFDANGDGVSDNEGHGPWNDFTSGVMWWGEGYGAQNDYVAGGTRPFSSSDFRILSAPLQTGSVQSPVLTIQFSRELASGSIPRMQLARLNADNGETYFWAPATVPVTAEIKGAYVVLTPSQPLQHGLTYALQAVDANGQPLNLITYTDGLGNTLNDGGRNLTIDSSLSATITLPSDAPMLTPGRAVTLSAASAQGANGIASYRWTQPEGTSVVFGDADKPNTTVMLAGSVSADTTTTVELQITDANGQVEYARTVIPVVANPGNSNIVSFRSQPGDYIGQGKQMVILSPLGAFQTSPFRPAFLRYQTQAGWTLDLAGGDGLPLHVGAYENATRASFSGPSSGLDFYGGGNGCNVLTGRFDVLDIAYDANGDITRMAVDFEQHCEGVTAALYGSFRYKSPMPVRP